MICPRCKYGQIDPESSKCKECGHKLSDADSLDLPAADELKKLVDKLLGKEFHIERMLGRGGMSIVYLARERELNRPVALKILPFQLVMGTPTLERFQREAKIAASLDHPHILPVFRVGSTSSFMWYSMKFVSGESLAEIVEQSGPMELSLVLDILGQAASALEHAHRRGIIHRDIKPENLMLDENGWVWVCDFGVAKAFGNVPLTQTGGTLGTPSYMSPEQCYGEIIDGRADQYALAILAYRCLAGQLPFEADSIGEMIRKQCLEPPPTLKNVRTDVPPNVSDALLKAMSKKPAERFETVTDFIQTMGGKVTLEPSGNDLKQFIHKISQPKLRAAQREKKQRLVRPLAYAAAMALVAAGAVALSNFQGNGGANATQPGTTALNPGVPADTAQPPGRTGTPPDTAPTTPAVREQTPTPRDPAIRGTTKLPARRPGVLFVSSDPWANIYLGDSALGTTFFPHGGLAPGVHPLRLRREGYLPYDTVVTIPAGDTVRVVNITLRPIP